MKNNLFAAIKQFIFGIFLLPLLLGGSGYAQPLQPDTGTIIFRTPPCGLLCSSQYWSNASEAEILETIAATHNPDALNAYGRTALDYAVTIGNVTHVEALLAKGADPLHRNANGETLLHVVAKGSMPSNFDLLAPYFSDFDVRDARGRTPLYAAITERRITRTIWIGFEAHPMEHRIQVLLDHGADINASDADGATALYRLITDDAPQMPMAFKRYLLEKGAVSIAPGGIECVIDDIPKYDFLNTRRGTEFVSERGRITQTCEPDGRH